MRNGGYWKLVLSLLASAALAWVSLDALPRFPDNVAWPRTVSWLAFASAVATLVPWFVLVAWLVERASRCRALTRTVLLAVIALAGSAAFVAPLLLAMLFLGTCRVALDCDTNAQGFFNVLSVFARYLSVGWSLLTSIVLVALAAAISQKLHRSVRLSSPAPNVGASDA